MPSLMRQESPLAIQYVYNLELDRHSRIKRQQALVFFQPKRVAIRDGYHGCHGSLEVYKKSAGPTFEIIDLDDEYQPGDLCWLETPLNPTGESRYFFKIH